MDRKQSIAVCAHSLHSHSSTKVIASLTIFPLWNLCLRQGNMRVASFVLCKPVLQLAKTVHSLTHMDDCLGIICIVPMLCLREARNL